MTRRRLYRLQRGSWVPARLTSSDQWLVLLALVILPLVRALDYSTGSDSGYSGSLAVVEAFAPIWMWSIPFYLGAMILAYGIVSRRHLVVYLGHSVLAVTYSSLFVGIMASVVTTPWLDGVRSASILTLPTLLHWLIWWRTGPAPLKVGEVNHTEQIGGPE